MHLFFPEKVCPFIQIQETKLHDIHRAFSLSTYINYSILIAELHKKTSKFKKSESGAVTNTSSRNFGLILFPLYNFNPKGRDGEKYAATRRQGRWGQKTEILPMKAAAEVRSRAARGNPLQGSSSGRGSALMMNERVCSFRTDQSGWYRGVFRPSVFEGFFNIMV